MAEHYFTRKPRSAASPIRIKSLINGIGFSFQSAGGVFAKHRIDAGTRALLVCMQLPEQGAVLDLGCGIGVIGIVVKKLHSMLTVCMSDVNERAIRLAAQNARANGVAVTIRTGDGFKPWPGTAFVAVLLNPPQHAGKETCFRLMREAHAHLVDGGTLQLVIQRNKGGKSFSAEMERVFGNVEEIGKAKGYGVYVSRKSA